MDSGIRFVNCEECNVLVPETEATSLDMSGPDDYYPDLFWFCSAHGPTVEEVV